jgi:hypothetical protein
VAYLDPEDLTCPGCGKTATVTWLVGEGPNTKQGDGPAYLSLEDAGPWTPKTEAAHPFWTGHLICPDCGAQVLHRPEAAKE